MSRWMYIVQRMSALIMLPLIVTHLVTMIIAVRGGLTATEILERTQGSTIWTLVYGLFVIAAAAHGAIGLRGIVREWTPFKGRGVDAFAAVFCVGLMAIGLRAVHAVTGL